MRLPALRDRLDDADRQRVLVGVLALAIVAVTGMVVAGAFLDDGAEVTGDITLNATDGPQATFTNMDDVADLREPLPDENTIRWESTAGNITISADSHVAFDVDTIEGRETKVSSADGTDVAVKLDPDDKQAVTFTNATDLSFTDMELDDGTTDFSILVADIGSDGPATVTISGFEAGQGILAKDSDGNILDGATADDNGDVTFEIEFGSFDVKLQEGGDSTTSLSNPQPEGAVDGFPTEISIDVEDDDFPDDEVEVEFEVDGTVEGIDTLTSDGTASTTIDNPGIGTTTVTARATDIFGNENSLTWTFSTPENLTIRDVTEPHGIIGDRQVNATFFDGDEIIERSTTDGKINMEGIPGKENVIVSLESQSGTDPENYYDVETLILDFTEQTDAYMLPTDVAERNVRFTLEDRTGGQWEGNNAVVLIQKAINQSSFDSPQWETIYADQFGPEGATATLEDGERYRIVIRNEDGDEKVLGTYSAKADETVPLEIGSSTFQPQGDNKEWAWNATFDATEDGTFVRFNFNDSEELTERIYIEIYEFRNESNILTHNQSFGGPHGNFSFSEQVPEGQENTTWQVEVTINRDGEVHKIKQPVGPNQPILTALSDRMKVVISIGTILIIGGLFSQLNGHVGGLVIAGLGGIFWYIGMLPGGTGIGVVVLAMVVAGAIFLREERRATI